jgi:hypothetical protein
VIVGKDYNFLFAGEVKVKDVVVAEIFSIAGLTEGVLAICFKGVVGADYAVFCNETGTAATV